MAVFRLTPLDATDRVWDGFPFLETVWTEAGNERAARVWVSGLALKMMGPPGLATPMRNWPWIYSARCTIDEGHAAIASGQVVGADGGPIGPLDGASCTAGRGQVRQPGVDPKRLDCVDETWVKSNMDAMRR
jgi:hypothetical protein